MLNKPRLIQVLLLTQEQCMFCEQAYDLLKRLACEYPLDVTTTPLASPRGQELALQGGIVFAPGIFFDGVPVCYGRPSERKLRREIEQALTHPQVGVESAAS